MRDHTRYGDNMTSPTLPRVTAAPPFGAPSVFTKHTVRVPVQDTSETVRRRYGTQVFRPEVICLGYVRSADTQGGWTVQKAEVSGKAVKHDGELGKSIARRDFADADDLLSRAPWWLTNLIEQHMPREVTS